MDPAEDLLRRVALNDENVLSDILTRQVSRTAGTEIGPRTDLLVRLGALLAVEAAAPSLREVVEKALAAGVSTNEIVGVLVCVGPTIGLASMVASASRLAAVIGYDFEHLRGETHGLDAADGGTPEHHVSPEGAESPGHAGRSIW